MLTLPGQGYRGLTGVNGVLVSEEIGAQSAGDLVRSFRAGMTPKPVAMPVPADVAQQIFAAAIRPTEQVKPKARTVKAGSRRYALAFVAATLAGMTAIVFANKSFAPEMYGTGGMVPAAEAHAKQLNYSVFDLNLNIRALRDEQLKRMTKTPDVIILGASHWQEAHKDLLKGYDFYNAHIHRDYWEDPLGMVELLVRNNRLPKKLIISIRDNQFTPVEARKDFLWEPGIPAYRAMTERLGIETESYTKTLPYDRARALLSLPMLFDNITRWYNAGEHPSASPDKHFETLDALLPDGSIVWSNKHMNLFTPERTQREVKSFVERRKDSPPLVAPEGVAAFESLLTFLKKQGVSVYLTHPPFNPMFYDAVQGTPYAEGLKNIEDITLGFAKDFNLPIFGSFNPHQMGCTSEMYIDAEHANEKCLQKVFDQFVALDKKQDGN
jgi:hypothetical protein